MLLCFPGMALASGQSLDVLVLHSYHRGYRWADNIMRGMDSILQDSTGKGPVVRVEYMDTKNHAPETLFPYLHDLYHLKYARMQPKVVLTSDDNALDFMLRNGDELFPGVPVVFCGVNNFRNSRLHGHDNYTGVVEDVDMVSTVEVAMKLHPEATRLVAVSDSTATGRINQERFKNTVESIAADKEILYFNLMTGDELASSLRNLSNDAIVFNLNFLRDSSGKVYSAAQGNRLIRDNTDCPIYSFWDFDLGTGIVGGMLVSGFSQGEAAALMALAIVKGRAVQDIPILRESPNRYMFDNESLAEHGLSVGDLPEGSVVINKPWSFYDVYWGEIIVILVVGLSMTVLILIMAVNILQRRRAQHELQSIFDNSQVGILHLKEGRFVYRLNQRLADILGYDDPDELWGADIRDLHLNEEQYRDFGKRYYAKLASRLKIKVEYQLRRKDGQPVWVELSGKALDLADPPDLSKGVVWIIEDISQRKQAQMELELLNRELESKVRSVLWT